MDKCYTVTLSGHKCKNRTKNGVCHVHIPKDQNECGICLGKLNCRLECSHFFCKKCIFLWIIEKEGYATCPTCRHVINNSIEKEAIIWGQKHDLVYSAEATIYPLSYLDDLEALQLMAYNNIHYGVAYTEFKINEILRNEESKKIFEKLEKMSIKITLYVKKNKHIPGLHKFI
jgi:hypothetical protein